MSKRKNIYGHYGDFLITMSKFSVIVPLFNRVDLTINFLKSIMLFMGDGEIILVDNGSTDNPRVAIDIIKRFYKNANIMLLELPKNVGFGMANNVGVTVVDSDYLFFVSNDVVFRGDCFAPVIKVLEIEDCLVGETLYQYDTGWNKFQPIGIVEYLGGHFLATRKDTFFDIGQWWEELFLDYEDLELSYRYTLAGKQLIEMKLPLQHLSGQTAYTQLSDREKYTLESQTKLMKKYGWTR